MTILITGAGIVGCQIAQQLAATGIRPILYDLSPNRDLITTLVADGTFELVQGDVRDAARLADVVATHKVDAIIHTAALLTGPSRANPRLAMEVNIGGALNVLELARSGQVRKVVLCSSTTVTYPAFDSYPLSPIPEDFSLRAISQSPASFYSATKLSSEFMASLYHRLLGVNVVVVRYGAVLGAWRGDNVGLVARMLGNLLGPARRGEVAVVTDPAHVWEGIEEFVDARDCATGTLAALRADRLPQHVYTLSSDRGWTVEQFNDVVREVCPGLRIRYEVQARGGFAGFPLVRRATSDISAAARDLGWRPHYSLKDSIEYFATVTAE